VNFTIVFDREDDGRWIAEIEELPGALVYGETREEAKAMTRSASASRHRPTVK